MDRTIRGDFARRSAQKDKNTVRLLRYNNHNCQATKIKAVFTAFCCPSCDTFFRRTAILERHLTGRSKRFKRLHPKNVYQI